jgi:hypothetical protein
MRAASGVHRAAVTRSRGFVPPPAYHVMSTKMGWWLLGLKKLLPGKGGQEPSFASKELCPCVERKEEEEDAGRIAAAPAAAAVEAAGRTVSGEEWPEHDAAGGGAPRSRAYGRGRERRRSGGRAGSGGARRWGWKRSASLCMAGKRNEKEKKRTLCNL